MNVDSEVFGIGELARRTKLTVSTIRAWEQRHGFPNAERLASGHRRYTLRDVDALNEVVAARAGRYVTRRRPCQRAVGGGSTSLVGHGHVAPRTHRQRAFR